MFIDSVRHHCPTQSHNELRNDIRKLIQFFSLVHGEKKFCNDSTFIRSFFLSMKMNCYILFSILVDAENALANGHSNIDRSDSSSKISAPTGWINALAGGGGAVAGVGGQSTMSRKSGT
jgi:hypothetical protein